jgi:hypothetical protein
MWFFLAGCLPDDASLVFRNMTITISNKATAAARQPTHGFFLAHRRIGIAFLAHPATMTAAVRQLTRAAKLERA